MKKIFQGFISNILTESTHKNSAGKNSAGKHTAWLDALSKQDDLIALQSATKGLEFALHDQALTAKALVQIIDEATQKTNVKLTRLSKQFIRCERLDPALENNILNGVYSFHKQLYHSYGFLLDHYQANPMQYELEDMYSLLHNIVNQVFEMLKWRNFLQLGLAPKIWLHLHKIYEIASKNYLLNQTLIFADNDIGDALTNDFQDTSQEIRTLGTCTLAARLVQTYMLDSLQQANLSRQGVDIVCKLLQTKLLNIEISNVHNPNMFLFYVDLEKDSGAKRLRHLAPTENNIYWHINNIEKILSVTVDNMQATDKTSDLANGSLIQANIFTFEIYQKKAALETFKSLLREWSRSEYRRQRRKENRQKVTTTANLVHGIKNVCDRIKAHENNKLNRGARLSADGKTLDERLRNHTSVKVLDNTINLDVNNHQWIIVDVSNHGVGALVSAELNTLVTVGQLIAIFLTDTKQDVTLAVARSSRAKANQQIQVGMEILSRHAKWAQLKLLGSKLNSPSGNIDDILVVENHSMNVASTNTFACLYLPTEAGLSETPTLVLPKIEFFANAKSNIYC